MKKLISIILAVFVLCPLAMSQAKPTRDKSKDKPASALKQRTGTSSSNSNGTPSMNSTSSSGKTNAPATLTVSNTDVVFHASGDSEFIQVESNRPWVLSSTSSSLFSVEKYGNGVRVTCNQNPSGEKKGDYFCVKTTDGSRLVRVNISLLRKEVVLSVNYETLYFDRNGGSKVVTVNSNGNWALSRESSNMFSVNRTQNNLYINCQPNNSINDRQDFFYVVSEDNSKAVKVVVIQKGVTFHIDNQRLFFHNIKNETQSITVVSEVGWSIDNPSKNINVQRHNNTITVTAAKNRSKERRTDYFYIVANGVSLRYKVEVKTDPDYSSTVFAPKTNDVFAFTLGAINPLSNPFIKAPTPGYSMGLKAEPLFENGLGLDIGLMANFYYQNQNNSLFYQGTNWRECFSLEIPLHLEYRLNLSKWFNLFAYAGPSINVLFPLAQSDDGVSLPVLVDVGAGLRFNRVQARIEKSYCIVDGLHVNNPVLGSAMDNFHLSLDFFIPTEDSRSTIKPQFNTPNTDYQWGFGAGYQKLNDGGVLGDFSIVFEPLFKHGLGLRTGIGALVDFDGGNYSNDDISGKEKLGVKVPLCLEYRFNFSEWFNFFIVGGPNFQYFNDYRRASLNAGVGAGFRIGRIQFHYDRSFSLGGFQTLGRVVAPYVKHGFGVDVFFDH